MLKVVRLLKVVTCSGPALVRAAGDAGVTFTVMASVAVQPSSSVTVSVYVVVAPGLATGLATLGSFNPAAGLHEKVYGVSPLLAVPFSCWDEPSQMVTLFGPALAVSEQGCAWTSMAASRARYRKDQRNSRLISGGNSPFTKVPGTPFAMQSEPSGFQPPTCYKDVPLPEGVACASKAWSTSCDTSSARLCTIKCPPPSTRSGRWICQMGINRSPLP